MTTTKSSVGGIRSTSRRRRSPIGAGADLAPASAGFIQQATTTTAMNRPVSKRPGITPAAYRRPTEVLVIAP